MYCWLLSDRRLLVDTSCAPHWRYRCLLMTSCECSADAVSSHFKAVDFSNNTFFSNMFTQIWISCIVNVCSWASISLPTLGNDVYHHEGCDLLIHRCCTTVPDSITSFSLCPQTRHKLFSMAAAVKLKYLSGWVSDFSCNTISRRYYHTDLLLCLFS